MNKFQSLAQVISIILVLMACSGHSNSELKIENNKTLYESSILDENPAPLIRNREKNLDEVTTDSDQTILEEVESLVEVNKSDGLEDNSSKKAREIEDNII